MLKLLKKLGLIVASIFVVAALCLYSVTAVECIQHDRAGPTVYCIILACCCIGMFYDLGKVWDRIDASPD